MWNRCVQNSGGGTNLTFTNVYNHDNSIVTSVSLNNLNEYKFLLIALMTTSPSVKARDYFNDFIYFNNPNAVELTPHIFSADAGVSGATRLFLLPVTANSMTLTNIRFWSAEIYGVKIN